MTSDYRNDRRRRPAFLWFEMLVAMAFLAVVSGFALRMHQSRLDYDRFSMDRLRRQLVIENFAEHLASVPYSKITEVAPGLARQMETQIQLNQFESGSNRGLHVSIQIESDSGPLNHHLWRLEPGR